MRVTPRFAKNTTQFCLNCWLRKQRPSIESVHKEKPGFVHRLSSKNPRWGHLHKALKPRFLKVPWENPFFFPKEKNKLAFTKRGIHSKRKCAMRNQATPYCAWKTLWHITARELCGRGWCVEGQEHDVKNVFLTNFQISILNYLEITFL